MAKVRSVMLVDVPTLKKEATLQDAARLLSKKNAGCVVIVENKTPVGIVTELDFVRQVISKGKNLKGQVKKIMKSPVTSMTPDMKLDEALKIIDTKGFRKYPVVKNNQLVGLVTKKSIVNSISNNLKFHRNIQNIVLLLFVLFEFFIFVIYKHVYKYFSFGA